VTSCKLCLFIYQPVFNDLDLRSFDLAVQSLITHNSLHISPGINFQPIPIGSIDIESKVYCTVHRKLNVSVLPVSSYSRSLRVRSAMEIVPNVCQLRSAKGDRTIRCFKPIWNWPLFIEMPIHTQEHYAMSLLERRQLATAIRMNMVTHLFKFLSNRTTSPVKQTIIFSMVRWQLCHGTSGLLCGLQNVLVKMAAITDLIRKVFLYRLRSPHIISAHVHAIP
jgi:hypothetical protein